MNPPAFRACGRSVGPILGFFVACPWSRPAFLFDACRGPCRMLSMLSDATTLGASLLACFGGPTTTSSVATGSASLDWPWLGRLVPLYINSVSQRNLAGTWITYTIRQVRLRNVAIYIFSVVLRNNVTVLSWCIRGLVCKSTSLSRLPRTRVLSHSALIRPTCTWDIATCGLGLFGAVAIAGLALRFGYITTVYSLPL